MFIEIDKSVISSPSVLLRHKHKIINLIETHYRGEHFLFFERKKEYVGNLRLLLEGEEFYSKILNKIVDDLTMNANLYKKMNTRCVIVEHIMDYHKVPNIIYIAISKLQVPVVETILLGENKIDADFYKELTELFIGKINEIYTGKIKCSTVGGGGSTTVQTLSGIVEEKKKFCLCITDSDFDGKKVTSDTSTKVEKFCSEYQGSFTHLKLPCRELENLIPPKYYLEVASRDKVDEVTKLTKRSFEVQKTYDYKTFLGDNIFNTYYNEKFIMNRNRFYRDLPDEYTEMHKVIVQRVVDWCCAPNTENYII